MMNFIFDNPQLSNLSSVEKMKYKLGFYISLFSTIASIFTFNIHLHLHQTSFRTIDLFGSGLLFLSALLTTISPFAYFNKSSFQKEAQRVKRYKSDRIALVVKGRIILLLLQIFS